MIGKLFGHTQVQTTARYAHLGLTTRAWSGARQKNPIIGNLVENRTGSPVRKIMKARNLTGIR